MKALSVFKTGERNNTMWLIVLLDLVVFAFAFNYGIDLSYCYFFLLIPVCVNMMLTPFNLVNLLVCIATIFAFLFGLELKIDDCVFISIIATCTLSFISYLRLNCKKKIKHKTIRTGRFH